MSVQVSSPLPFSYTPSSAGVQTAGPAQGPQAAGAAGANTGVVPAEVGQSGAPASTNPSKPTLKAPHPSGAKAAHEPSLTESKNVGTARKQADAKMDRATLLREIRTDRREAVCAQAFELQDFAQLVTGPLMYCLKNPAKVVVGALAIAAATATAITTGNLSAFKAAMPAVSPMIAGLVKSSGVNNMIERGTELALLTLGVDPNASEKLGNALGSAALVGANVVMNALGGTWDKIDFSSAGELAADVAVLLNVPAKNAAALKSIVSMVGTGAVAIGAGIVAGDYKELTVKNFGTVWETLNTKLKEGNFKLADITGLEAYKSMAKSWGEVTQDFGSLQEFVQALSALVAPDTSSASRRA